MVGQIRKLYPSGINAASRLVLIADRDPRDGTYLVFLLNNLIEAATPRDLCISKSFTSSNYDLVLMTEYLSRANPENIDISEVFGYVNQQEIERIRDIAFRFPFGSLPKELSCDGVSIGRYPVQKFDSVWQFRSSEFDNFQSLTYVRDTDSIDYSTRFLQHNQTVSDLDLIDEIPLIALFAMSRSGEKVLA